jgi:hypothetical protein
MNDHLLRCRCASAPHVRTQYAPVRALAAPCIWPSLNGLPEFSASGTTR